MLSTECFCALVFWLSVIIVWHLGFWNHLFCYKVYDFNLSGLLYCVLYFLHLIFIVNLPNVTLFAI